MYNLLTTIFKRSSWQLLPVIQLPIAGLSIRLTSGFFFRPAIFNFKSLSTIFNFHTKQSGYTIISFTNASITSSGMLCVEKLKSFSNPYFNTCNR